MEILAGNSRVLLEHCKKLVDNLQIEATVAKQVLVETQQRLEGLEREACMHCIPCVSKFKIILLQKGVNSLSNNL